MKCSGISNHNDKNLQMSLNPSPDQNPRIASSVLNHSALFSKSRSKLTFKMAAHLYHLLRNLFQNFILIRCVNNDNDFHLLILISIASLNKTTAQNHNKVL